MGRKTIDLTGKVFCKLKVVKRFSGYAETPVKWLCMCECGRDFVTTGQRLKNGSSKSCGCSTNEFIGKANRVHGMSKTRIHKTWSHMIERCTCETHKQFNYYGGRGIKVCEEWMDFNAFLIWALDNGYDKELTIDRIDVNGNYEPNNCRWVDHYIQANNTRVTLFATINGTTKSLSDWSKETGINKGTLYGRFRKGLRGSQLIEPINRNYSRSYGIMER